MDKIARASDLFYQGLHALNQGNLLAAEASLTEALALAPDRPSVLTNLSLVYAKTGRHDEALSLAKSAKEIDSKNAYCWLQLGAVELALKRYGEALKTLDVAIDMDATIAEAFNNRGYALNELKRPEEALASCDKAIELNATIADAHNNRGVILGGLGRFSEAIESYDRAIQLNASLAEAHFNRSKALMELKRFQEAVCACDDAIRINSEVAEYHNNRGNAAKEIGLFGEALASYDYSISLKPDDATARYNKASLLLGIGEFSEGFKLYKTRWDLEGCDGAPLFAGIPEWSGESFDGNLLVWAEQGIGDEIFYASMLPLVPSDRPRVVLCADRRLHAIFERSFPGVRLVDRVHQNIEFYSQFDAQISLVDLWGALRINADRLLTRRYPFALTNQERKAEILNENGFMGHGLTCGIAWKSANKKLSRQKSIRLLDLAPLLAVSNLSFVNLQYGDVEEEIAEAKRRLGAEIHQVAGLDVFNDIDGLLALIDACDYVLTTSNVTAHLAGAIGKKAIVLVPSGEGRLWYWFGGPDSLWYPSLELVPQGVHADWRAPIDLAASKLEKYL